MEIPFENMVEDGLTFRHSFIYFSVFLTQIISLRQKNADSKNV